MPIAPDIIPGIWCEAKYALTAQHARALSLVMNQLYHFFMKTR